MFVINVCSCVPTQISGHNVSFPEVIWKRIKCTLIEILLFMEVNRRREEALTVVYKNYNSNTKSI